MRVRIRAIKGFEDRGLVWKERRRWPLRIKPSYSLNAKGVDSSVVRCQKAWGFRVVLRQKLTRGPSSQGLNEAPLLAVNCQPRKIPPTFLQKKNREAHNSEECRGLGKGDARKAYVLSS